MYTIGDDDVDEEEEEEERVSRMASHTNWDDPHRHTSLEVRSSSRDAMSSQLI